MHMNEKKKKKKKKEVGGGGGALNMINIGGYELQKLREG